MWRCRAAGCRSTIASGLSPPRLRSTLWPGSTPSLRDHERRGDPAVARLQRVRDAHAVEGQRLRREREFAAGARRRRRPPPPGRGSREARSPPKPSTRPGVTASPLPSMTRAPGGARDVGPDRVDEAVAHHDRALLVDGAPDTVITRAPTIAWVSACCASACERGERQRRDEKRVVAWLLRRASSRAASLRRVQGTAVEREEVGERGSRGVGLHQPVVGRLAVRVERARACRRSASGARAAPGRSARSAAPCRAPRPPRACARREAGATTVAARSGGRAAAHGRQRTRRRARPPPRPARRLQDQQPAAVAADAAGALQDRRRDRRRAARRGTRAGRRRPPARAAWRSGAAGRAAGRAASVAAVQKATALARCRSSCAEGVERLAPGHQHADHLALEQQRQRHPASAAGGPHQREAARRPPRRRTPRPRRAARARVATRGSSGSSAPANTAARRPRTAAIRSPAPGSATASTAKSVGTTRSSCFSTSRAPRRSGPGGGSPRARSRSASAL